MKNQINQLQNDKNPNNNPIETINKLVKENKFLRETLKKCPYILKKNEKLISIIFYLDKEKKYYSLICKNTDTIHKLEEKLYNKFPNNIENDNIFLFKDKILNKFENFEKIGINNGDIIIVKQKKL